MSTTTLQTEETRQSAGQRPSHDVFQLIHRLSVECRAAPAFYRGLLELYAVHFQAHCSAMNLCNAAESLDEDIALGDNAPDAWKRLTAAIMLESQADRVALAKLYDIDGTGSRVAVLAVPLHDEQQYRGAIALIVACRDRADGESLLFELRALTALACSLVASAPSRREQAAPGSDVMRQAMSRAAQFGSASELAFAMTNGLKTKFQCDQVVLGKVHRGRVQILSLSGMDALYPRSPGTRLIRQAMEECLDCGSVIHSKPGNEWSSDVKRDYRLHRQWRASIGDEAVASVPLKVDGRCVAVLSLTRPGNVGFQSEELAEIAQLAEAYAPAFQLVTRAGRGWLIHTLDSLRGTLQWLFEQSRWGRRAVVAGVVALTIWFCMGTWQYQLSAPCQLLPTQLHYCAAPFEGTIKQSYVEVGDQVKKGQLLYVMETDDLELERSELRSEAAVLELQVAQAAGRRELEVTAMAQARLQVTLTRLAGVERRIELAQVRAPDDGIIMAGEVDRRVGEVVKLGEPLLEFAPHGSWAVEVRVHSRDVQLVSRGQIGRFVTIARPDQAVVCQVDRIAPAATVMDGQTVYVAHAHITSNSAWSLAGMDGVATLEVGRRPVWWVVLHRGIDFVRLNFWV